MKNKLFNFLKRSVSLLVVAVMAISFSLIFTAEEETTGNPFDYTWLNRTPSGSYGNLTVDEDGFAFKQGGIKTTVRFFGVDFSFTDGIPSPEESEAIAKDLYNCGINLVRCKDLYSALTTGGQIDDAKFEQFDNFVHSLYSNGIYIEADMFTTSSLGTNTVGAFVDEAAVSRAILFLKAFFTHVGLNNQMTYAEDPTIAIVKYIDSAAISYLNEGETLAHAGVLQPEFNKWLIEKYKDRATLQTAWTSVSGVCVLGESEDPNAGTVAIGTIGNMEDVKLSADVQNNARQADFAEFLVSVQTKTYNRLKDSLLSYGFKSVFMCSDASTGPLSTKLSGMGDIAGKSLYLAEGDTLEDAFGKIGSGVIAGKPFVAHFDSDNIRCDYTFCGC